MYPVVKVLHIGGNSLRYIYFFFVQTSLTQVFLVLLTLIHSYEVDLLNFYLAQNQLWNRKNIYKI